MLAITDHDTTGGWAEAAAALPTGMRLVRGAEFSCVSPTGRAERPVSVHLLGYLFDPAHPAIVAEQARLRDERVARLARITEKMAADGYPVDVESVFELVPDGTSVGRPHLARALVAAGRGRVGERRVRHAAAQRQPLLRAQGRHARRAGDRDGAGRRAASRCSRIRSPAVAAGWWSRP